MTQDLSHFGPLPDGKANRPVKSGQFMDIQVYGSISAGGTITGGDYISTDWDGAIPLSLPDAGASAGYAMDSSVGIGQFEVLYADGSNVTDINADNITSGDLDASVVPIDNLDGVTNASGVTVINGGKITTGTIDASVATITNIDADNISTGTLSATRIASNSLSPAKLSTGETGAITITIGTSGKIQSTDADPDVVINGDGSAVFKNVTVEGTLQSSIGYFPVNTTNTKRMILGDSLGTIPNNDSAIQWYTGGTLTDSQFFHLPSIYVTSGSSSGDHATLQLNSGRLTGQGGALITLQSESDTGGDPSYIAFAATDGTNIANLFMYGQDGASANAFLTPDKGDATAGALKFLTASATVQVRTGSDSAYATLKCDTLEYNGGSLPTSLRSMKADVHTFDPFPILLGAPSYDWRYKRNNTAELPIDRRYYGPMVEDLIDHPLLITKNGESIRQENMTGVLWEAVRQLTMRIDQLEGRTAG